MLESEIQKMNPDMESIEQYRQKDAEYTARMTELEVATAERDLVGGEAGGGGGDYTVMFASRG